jgi:hypothetical protein
MTFYQNEQLIVEQQNIFNNIDQYIKTESTEHELHRSEEVIFSELLKLGHILLQRVVANHGDGGKRQSIQTTNGEQLPRHGKKTKLYHSIFGSITIERAYYWKLDSKGICPLDAKLNLPRNSQSYLLQKWVQSGVAENPYEQTAQNLSKLLHLDLASSEQQLISRKAAQLLPDYYKQKNMQEADGKILVATADCKGVAMVPSERPSQSKGNPSTRRGKGEKKKGLRKDAVVTSDYSFNPEPRQPGELIEGLMKVNSNEAPPSPRKKKSSKIRKREPINKQVNACMFGKQQAISDLADRLAQRDPSATRSIFVLLDGEKSLKTGIEKEFAKRNWNGRIAGYCLDIIHALEYLWDASTALHGEKNPKRSQWVHQQTLALLDGRVGRVIGGLKQVLNKRDSSLKKSQTQALEKVIIYFENHKDMMCYDEYLKRGFPIATGIIEGACSSLVKDRTDRSGMKWTKVGAQAVLNLRALKRNGDWEAYWLYYMESERKRLYGSMALAA